MKSCIFKQRVNWAGQSPNMMYLLYFQAFFKLFETENPHYACYLHGLDQRYWVVHPADAPKLAGRTNTVRLTAWPVTAKTSSTN